MTDAEQIAARRTMLWKLASPFLDQQGKGLTMTEAIERSLEAAYAAGLAAAPAQPQGEVERLKNENSIFAHTIRNIIVAVGMPDPWADRTTNPFKDDEELLSERISRTFGDAKKRVDIAEQRIKELEARLNDKA